MFFWFGFPFLFLLPLLFVALAVRAGSHFFRSMDTTDRRRSVSWDGSDTLSDIYGVPRRSHSPEARVFQLARKLGGRLTVSDVVIDLGLDVRDAEELLQSLVDNVRVRMEVDDNGRVTYEFPEIIDRFEEDRS